MDPEYRLVQDLKKDAEMRDLRLKIEAQGASLEECRQQLVKYATLREAVKKLLPTLEYNCPPTVLAELYAALAD